MLSKEQVRSLVDLIIMRTKKTQEEIAEGLGYSSNYISDVLSPSGKVTKKFIDKINKEYSDLLENPNIPSFQSDPIELIRKHEARITRIESALNVLGEKFAELKYDANGISISQTLTELENEIKDRYQIRLKEGKK
jgi:transcriptional regulator with XRE-family HTH domain